MPAAVCGGSWRLFAAAEARIDGVGAAVKCVRALMAAPANQPTSSPPLRPASLQYMPGTVRRGAGNSLGACDARYLQGNDVAKDWLLRFIQVSLAGRLGRARALSPLGARSHKETTVQRVLLGHRLLHVQVACTAL